MTEQEMFDRVALPMSRNSRRGREPKRILADWKQVPEDSASLGRAISYRWDLFKELCKIHALPPPKRRGRLMQLARTRKLSCDAITRQSRK